MASVNGDIEILLASFERPKCLKRFLKSIREFTPDINVTVLDDSRSYDCHNMAQKYATRAFRTLHNTGIGRKRNLLLDKCEKDFFMVIDDDCYFTEETNFEKAVDVLRNSDIDVLGLRLIDSKRGDISKCRCLFEKRDGNIHLNWEGNYGVEHGCEVVDIISNCFIAKTSRVREEGVRWDDDLKLYEAFSFFFRGKGKLKFAYLPQKLGKCVIQHDKREEEQSDYYKKHNPGQHDKYRKILLDNEGVKEIVKTGRKGRRENN